MRHVSIKDFRRFPQKVVTHAQSEPQLVQDEDGNVVLAVGTNDADSHALSEPDDTVETVDYKSASTPFEREAMESGWFAK